MRSRSVEDGTEYTQVALVKGNTEGATSNAFAPVNARYVKLVVNKPTQGSDTAARIYEMQVRWRRRRDPLGAAVCSDEYIASG